MLRFPLLYCQSKSVHLASSKNIKKEIKSQLKTVLLKKTGLSLKHAKSFPPPIQSLMGLFKQNSEELQYTALMCQIHQAVAPHSVFQTPLALAIELLNLAVQLHDQICSEPETTPLSLAHLILMGDFCYTQALQTLLSQNSAPALQIMARATQKMAELELNSLSPVANSAPHSTTLQKTKILLQTSVELLFTELESPPPQANDWIKLAKSLSPFFKILHTSPPRIAFSSLISYTGQLDEKQIQSRALSFLEPLEKTVPCSQLKHWILTGCGSAW